MNTNTKKTKVKKLVADMLKQSHKAMVKDIEKALNSGSIDIESWDGVNSPMILPKVIVTALLIKESKQYEAKGTQFEKQVKKDVQNLLYFI